MAMILTIGNKSFSSWSLRPWLAMRHAGLDFEEEHVLLGQPDTAGALSAISPTGKVPVLKHDGLIIPESLAILEYLAELAPEAGLLPADRRTRAMCRAVATEMHGGFAALRNHCSMNLRRHDRPRAGGNPPGVQTDIARICAVWNSCRAEFGKDGPFLFGTFTIADAMFAPVTTRFTSYGLPRDAVSEAYIQAVQTMPAFLDWKRDAALETASYPSTEDLD